MGPSIPAAAISAPLNSLSYPVFSISGIMTLQRMDATALLLPRMAESRAAVKIVQYASPPRIQPTISMTKSNSLRVTPPPFISSPATIKKGIQVRLVILIPANIRWGITEK